MRGGKALTEGGQEPGVEQSENTVVASAMIGACSSKGAVPVFWTVTDSGALARRTRRLPNYNDGGTVASVGWLPTLMPVASRFMVMVLGTPPT